MYDIKEGRWYNEMPCLLIGRSNHSSCCLGNYLYVCGGYSKNRSFMLDIEYLRLDVLDKTSRWQQTKPVVYSHMMNYASLNPLMAPISETEILVLGGLDRLSFRSDGVILNTVT